MKIRVGLSHGRLRLLLLALNTEISTFQVLVSINTVVHLVHLLTDLELNLIVLLGRSLLIFFGCVGLAVLLLSILSVSWLLLGLLLVSGRSVLLFFFCLLLRSLLGTLVLLLGLVLGLLLVR